MIRKMMTTFALILTFGLVATPVTAQDFDAESMEFAGLEGIHARLYLTEAALSGEPGIMGVMVVGFDFDTATTAESLFETIVCGFAGGMLDVEDEGDCQSLLEAGVAVTKVSEIGNQAIEIAADLITDDATPTLVLATQEENRIFMVMYLGDNTPGIADDFAAFLADAEPQDSAVVFDAAGRGSGGFFDMLPQDGDAVVDGLVPYEDMDIFSEMREGES